jgi:glycerol-3-phosphate acyltransferase PlsY
VLVGAATLLLLCPPVALVCAAVGISTIAASRYASLGSLVGAALAPLLMALRVARGRSPLAYLLYCVGMATFIVVRHRDNVSRLLAGTERKLGQKAEKVT